MYVKMKKKNLLRDFLMVIEADNIQMCPDVFLLWDVNSFTPCLYSKLGHFQLMIQIYAYKYIK